MAEEASSTVPADAPPVSENVSSHVIVSSLNQAQPASATAEPAPTNGHPAATEDVEESDGKQTTTGATAPDGSKAEAADLPTDVPETQDSTEATPASGKKEKRRSSVGVPEHKMKKLNKKKSMQTLHLDCKPGEMYWARLKGYPPWPSIICDEQMLPESLLASRPVSTTRPDGSLRDDFKEGGKNAKERTFPIMFLYTNEFSWMVNTALSPLDPKECAGTPKSKMTKALQSAYKLASENHPLSYYKELLVKWQEEEQAIRKEKAEMEAEQARLAEEAARKEADEAAANAEEKEAKDKKKKARKSKGGDDEDVEMEDADAPKSSKKRKKEGESDAEGAKPKKTPKVTKINAPKTNGDTPAKKSASKPKKKVSAPKAEEAEEEEKPELTEAEKLAQRERAVLYLRHRLQKGFLSRDQAPKEAEMAAMDDFMTQLETYENVEPAVIRNTKIHKVLKAIVKLVSIPKDEKYQFKKRSAAMLEIWNKRMEADGDAQPASAVEPKSAVEDEDKSMVDRGAEMAATTNGETKEGAEQEIEKQGEEEVADKAEEKIDEKTGGKADEGNITMEDARDPPTAATAEQPVGEAEAEKDAAEAA